MKERFALVTFIFLCASHAHGFGGHADVSISSDGAQRADYSVEIVNGSDADERWYVTGACSDQPDEIVRFHEGYEVYPADKTVNIVEGMHGDSADRSVCIYLPSMLSHKLRKQLGLL